MALSAKSRTMLTRFIGIKNVHPVRSFYDRVVVLNV
jgi:hypothetical protein